MMLRRTPVPALAAHVECLWTSERGPAHPEPVEGQKKSSIPGPHRRL